MPRRLLFVLVLLSLGFEPVHAEDRDGNVSALIARCKPAIVAIVVLTTTKLPEEVASPLKTAKVKGQDVFVYVSGSGFLVSEDGYLVTAAHVVEGVPQPIWVVLQDDSIQQAKIVTQSPQGDHDYALLKLIDNKSKLQRLEFGKFDNVQEGQEVLLMGHPFGEGYVSSYKGIVAALPKGQPSNLLQLDMVVNSGISGGPVIDISTGKVVGIAKAKVGKLSPYLAKIKNGDFKFGVQFQGGDFNLQKFVNDVATVMDEHIQMGVGLAMSSEYAEQGLASEQGKKH